MTRASQDGRRGGIERALAYPFSIPSGSYVFDGADAIPLDDYFSERGISFSELISGRTPVLAVGSNASPYQLRTKRDCYSLFGEIPVIKARLSGFDVVYSARITSYGFSSSGSSRLSNASCASVTLPPNAGIGSVAGCGASCVSAIF